MRNFSIFELASFELSSFKLSAPKRHVGKLIALCLTAYFAMFGIVAEQAVAQTQADHSQNSMASGAWRTIEPGGDTLCSDGTPYRFLVRPGDPTKLLFHLQGGGGCWRRENCDPNMQPTYRINTEDLTPPSDGVFAFDNKNNPFADYSVVMVAYCSGDIHLGSRDMEYPAVTPDQQPLTIYHRGRANVESALQWTYANLPAPTEVFVSGSSAGALPSPMYASLLADHYPDAKFAHLGDAAGGYLFDTPDTRPRDIWGTFEFLNNTPGFENIPGSAFSYEALYTAAAEANPQILFARYDNAEDRAQKAFLAMRGVTDISLLTSLQANNQDIRNQVKNFRAYIAGGDLHTILGKAEFYELTAQDITIRDWVAALAKRQPVVDVQCQDCTVHQTVK